MSKLIPNKHSKVVFLPVGILVAVIVLVSANGQAAMPEKVNAIYLPPHCFTERKVAEIAHYAELADLNAVVLHVKDPYGKIRWKSKNRLAQKMGAVASKGRVEQTLRQLKKMGLWCIAKVDVFADHRLVYHNPDLGILDIRTGGPWIEKNGLYWANPYNSRVWEYNIALCRELVELGFDEIQFDYIRFPSDGDLTVINYPDKNDDVSRVECIGNFLAAANKQLKPTGATISVDVFGLVAWRTEDFGVGQNLEAMAPNIDVICPMLYPSHFSKGFLAQENTSDNPLEIMEQSMKRLQGRTKIRIRPWIQGFWYTPAEINAQIDGLDRAQARSWSVWNPSGNYSKTYAAIEARLNRVFPAPRFYPSVTEIAQNKERAFPGKSKIVNLTNYEQGYTIISLERSTKGAGKSYSTLNKVLGTLDEGIMDRILSARQIPFSWYTTGYQKKRRLVQLICEDLQVDPRALTPKPIYIDWQNGCMFTRTVPRDRLKNYRFVNEAAFRNKKDIYAKVPGLKRR
ncbi:glycoside hydrolase [Olavius algarvensis Delta 1 endosymbiont]|nr:glycoside hydrolase [Olavius algarvensis Delta 1 endosymbiont]